MASPINPAHGSRLPHSKLTSKTAYQIRQRWESRKNRLLELDEQIDKLMNERSQLKLQGTVKQLAFEFGVHKTSIERVIYMATFYRTEKNEI